MRLPRIFLSHLRYTQPKFYLLTLNVAVSYLVTHDIMYGTMCVKYLVQCIRKSQISTRLSLQSAPDCRSFLDHNNNICLSYLYLPYISTFLKICHLHRGFPYMEC